MKHKLMKIIAIMITLTLLWQNLPGAGQTSNLTKLTRLDLSVRGKTATVNTANLRPMATEEKGAGLDLSAEPSLVKLRGFFKGQLYEFMRYWLRQVDWRYGGVLNCLDNSGKDQLYDYKFVWSQGRFAWLMAHLWEHSKGELPEAERQKLLDAARKTVEFLMRYARLDGGKGNCAFVLSREGEPIIVDGGKARPPKERERYDSSILADQFAIYGVAEYARVSGDKKAWEWARSLYNSICERYDNGTACLNQPYPPFEGYKTHTTYMLPVEEGRLLATTARLFSDNQFAEDMERRARENKNIILDHFVQPDGLLRECLDDKMQPVDSLIGRYVNPGHTLESMWFIIMEAIKERDFAAIKKAADVCRATIQRSWDSEAGGGIPQFIDFKGGEPKGDLSKKFESHPMLQKLKVLWDKKLWWPHSEALVTLLLVYEQTDEEWALEWFNKFKDYAFRVFPNPDQAVGEWIQIRDRSGNPDKSVVALPVKDPMHIMRSFMHVIEILDRMIDAKKAAPNYSIFEMATNRKTGLTKDAALSQIDEAIRTIRTEIEETAAQLDSLSKEGLIDPNAEQQFVFLRKQMPSLQRVLIVLEAWKGLKENSYQSEVAKGIAQRFIKDPVLLVRLFRLTAELKAKTEEDSMLERQILGYLGEKKVELKDWADTYRMKCQIISWALAADYYNKVGPHGQFIIDNKLETSGVSPSIELNHIMAGVMLGKIDRDDAVNAIYLATKAKDTGMARALVTGLSENRNRDASKTEPGSVPYLASDLPLDQI